MTKNNDTHYVIKHYDLKNFYALSFEEHYKGNYIKMKDVEQNSKGDFYHVVYMDDGKFRLRSFGKDSDYNCYNWGTLKRGQNNLNSTKKGIVR